MAWQERRAVQLPSAVPYHRDAGVQCSAAAGQTLLGDHVSCAIGLVVQSALHRAQLLGPGASRDYGGRFRSLVALLRLRQRLRLRTEDAQESWG